MLTCQLLCLLATIAAKPASNPTPKSDQTNNKATLTLKTTISGTSLITMTSSTRSAVRHSTASAASSNSPAISTTTNQNGTTTLGNTTRSTFNTTEARTNAARTKSTTSRTHQNIHQNHLYINHYLNYIL